MHWHWFLVTVVAAMAAANSFYPFKSDKVFAGKSMEKRGQLWSCSLTSAVLPQRGSAPELPDPSPGLTLKHVGMGRGTQNYTCATADDSSVPVAIGAMASLYDASCLISSNSELYDKLASRILQLSQAVNTLLVNMACQVFNAEILLGIHYFPLPKTPLFDLRFNKDTDWATALVFAKVPAPVSADTPAVDWLKLTRKDGSGIQVRSDGIGSLPISITVFSLLSQPEMLQSTVV
jgi:hypothetical protein